MNYQFDLFTTDEPEEVRVLELCRLQDLEDAEYHEAIARQYEEDKCRWALERGEQEAKREAEFYEEAYHEFMGHNDN